MKGPRQMEQGEGTKTEGAKTRYRETVTMHWKIRAIKYAPDDIKLTWKLQVFILPC